MKNDFRKYCILETSCQQEKEFSTSSTLSATNTLTCFVPRVKRVNRVLRQSAGQQASTAVGSIVSVQSGGGVETSGRNINELRGVA